MVLHNEARSGKEDNELLGHDEKELLNCGDKMNSLEARRTGSSSAVRRITRFLTAVGATSILAKMGRRSFSTVRKDGILVNREGDEVLVQRGGQEALQ